jgi:hypothetical protein
MKARKQPAALAALDSQALDALVKHILANKRLVSKIVFAWLKENNMHLIDDKLAETLIPRSK